jgi:hypothetical protein
VYDFSKVFREYLETVRDDIRREMQSQGRNASGYASNSLRIVANQRLQAELRGVRYFEALQRGVKPKGISPAFVGKISSWMRSKGIEGSAFAIARSIVQRGTAIYRGQRGIDIDSILQDNRTQLLDDMGREIVFEFKKGLKVRGVNTSK